MKALLGALRELYGLFVEDGRYTVAILLWVALLGGAAMVFPGQVARWGGPVLFLGLAVLLVGSVWGHGRAASHSKRTPPGKREP